MKKYIWCWCDEDGSYINTTDLLETIVNTVLDSHYFDSDNVYINLMDGRFKVEIIDGAKISRYEFEESEDAVCEFLQEISFELGRLDRFDIVKATSLAGSQYESATAFSNHLIFSSLQVVVQINVIVICKDSTMASMACY